MLILMVASLSCATIAWCCPLCPMPRRRNISAFCPTTAHSLFAPQFSFAHPPQQSGSQLDVQKATGQIANAQRDLVFPKVPRQQRLWWKLDVCERYTGGCRETVRGDFCFDFCDPMRGFAGPARVARGWQRWHQAWPHTPHIWNLACMESFADETTTKRVNQLWSPAAPTMATILNLSS